METINLTSIKKEFTVAATQETAFKIFTEKMSLWWPRTHHIGDVEMTEIVVEPRVNCRWYSKHVDGSEADNGYVITYQPYNLLVLAWQINADFKCDPTLVTEVVTEFIAEGPEVTRIKFEHKNLDKLGNSKAVESMNEGWSMILDLYKKQLEQ